MRRIIFSGNLIVWSALIIFIFCLAILFITTAKLPDVSQRNSPSQSFSSNPSNKISKFGEMMIEMLPEDLPFTVFMPSEHAFHRDLRLQVNSSLVSRKRNDTYAIISRVLAFSAVPDRILSGGIFCGQKKVTVDSVSGLQLYISKDREGRLVVNRIQAEQMDINIGKIVLHIMNGTIMDAEFERSLL